MIDHVTILSSGVTLGVYVPALLVERQLHDAGVMADVEVLEDLYTDEGRSRLEKMRDAFRANFALAQMAHRVPTDASASLDPDRSEALLTRWESEGRRRFVVWSGFWLTVLDRYAERVGVDELAVDLCRIDAVVSTSFRDEGDWRRRGREIWFWSADEGRLIHELPVPGADPRPFEERPRRCVAHGGGWSLGTFERAARDLESTEFDLDVIVGSADEVAPHARRRYLTVDPTWSPSDRGPDGRPTFPPLGPALGASSFETDDSRSPVFDRIARSRAVISKPGGGTLVDSLAAATPLVLLEPYGPAERENAALWERLGFGISFDRWRDRGFDAATLERLHRNLLERDRETIDYPRALAREAVRRDLDSS